MKDMVEVSLCGGSGNCGRDNGRRPQTQLFTLQQHPVPPLVGLICELRAGFRALCKLSCWGEGHLDLNVKKALALEMFSNLVLGQWQSWRILDQVLSIMLSNELSPNLSLKRWRDST